MRPILANAAAANLPFTTPPLSSPPNDVLASDASDDELPDLVSWRCGVSSEGWLEPVRLGCTWLWVLRRLRPRSVCLSCGARHELRLLEGAVVEAEREGAKIGECGGSCWLGRSVREVVGEGPEGGVRAPPLVSLRASSA